MNLAISLRYLKIAFFNLIILLSILIIAELFLGSWFKNKFNMKIAQERNINRVYKFDFEPATISSPASA